METLPKPTVKDAPTTQQSQDQQEQPKNDAAAPSSGNPPRSASRLPYMSKPPAEGLITK